MLVVQRRMIRFLLTGSISSKRCDIDKCLFCVSFVVLAAAPAEVHAEY